jgi:hypothetical protein
MKKVIFYFTIVLFILSSCDPLEKVYKELDAKDTGYKNDVVLNLTAADYASISDLAKVANPADGAFIKSKMYFSDVITASKYLPPFLGKKYPALKLGSTAMVTYNYNGALPEDLVKYTNANTYTLRKSDYVSVDNVLQATKYFSPKYAPEVYIPEILADNVAAPVSGDLILVTYDYSTGDPVVDFANTADVPFWQENFETSLGTFTAYNQLGAQVWTWASYSPLYAKMSGYASGANQDNEDWLISGPIDLTDVPTVSFNFRQTAKYVFGNWDQLGVLVSANWNGTQAGISTAAWTTLSGYTLPAGSDWIFVESGKIDFSSYKDHTIHIAFKYISSSTIPGPSGNSATWEIDWAKLLVPGIPVYGTAPQTYKTFYEFDGTAWVKAENLYYLNSIDYKAMGAPGKFDNFDLTMPAQNYLPALLKSKFPLAGQGSEIVAVYKYYEGTTMTLADKYKFDNGAWVSSYNFVQPRTSQFLYSIVGWVFDPTVSFKMAAPDYQIIVDWVKINIGPDLIFYSGTQEYYTGAGSTYANFDIRANKWDETVFSTWEDAAEFAIGSVLLPARYPAAVTQVSGVNVNYNVSFVTYSGSYGNYTWKFQCTKSGPNPEFSMVK